MWGMCIAGRRGGAWRPANDVVVTGAVFVRSKKGNPRFALARVVRAAGQAIRRA